MAVKYYAVLGIGQSIDKPSGLIRQTSPSVVERLLPDFTWQEDPEAFKHLVGLDDDFEEVSKEQASKIIAAFKAA